MKKKFTMLFAALLAFVGVAKAQTAATYADGLYKIYWQSDNRGYLTYHEGEYPNEPQLSGVTLAGCADKHYASDAEGIQVAWYLYTSENTEKSYLFEATTGKFIAINPAENAGNGKTCVLTTEVSAHAQMNLFATDGNYAGSYMFRYTVDGKNYHFCSGCGSEKNAHPVRFSGDGQNDGGSRFVFVEDAGLTISDDIKNAAIAKIEAFESKIITVTYKYVYGDQVWGTEVVEVVKGEAYTQTTAPLGVSFTYPEGVVADDLTEGAEVEIACTLNGQLPFVPAVDYASIENWYYLNIHSNGYYLGYEANQEYISLDKTSVPTNNVAAYAWAFIGNPFDGYYQIVNYAAGEGYILSSSTNTADGNTGANTFPIMTKTPVPEGNNTYWVPSTSTNRQNGFYLAQKDHANNKMNNRGSKLAYWNGGADAGSTFNAIACDPTAIEVTVKYSFTYEGVEKYSQSVTAVTGNEWPAITVALPYGVSATKPAGVIGTADMVDGIAAKAIELSVAELPFVAAADVNSIDTWYYARMHTNQPGYIGDIADDKTINVDWGKASDVYSENFVWGFVGNVFDGITVVNKGTGLQITSTGSGDATLTAVGTPFFVARTTETSANATNGFCLRKKDSNNYLNANYGTGKLSHWSSTDAGSTIFLTKYEEAAISISSVNWATMYLGYAAYIPEGVNAYTVASTEGGYATLNQLEGVIPANTGVLLENEEGEYTFKKAAKDLSAIEGNLLRGSVENSYVEGLAYVLAVKNDVVGLYKATLNKNAEGAEGTTHFLNNAGKAYLVLPAEAEGVEAPAMFTLGRGGEDEDATGIDQLISNGEVVIYDLSGRRVEKMEKGIYIVNGKKVVK